MRTDVRTCLHTLYILAIDRQVLVDADVLAGSDFEDNIQIAAVVAVALAAVVTRDPFGRRAFCCNDLPSSIRQAPDG